MTGEYIGEKARLRGHRALLLLPGQEPNDRNGIKRRISTLDVLAQFTTAPDCDPACLKTNGPPPASDDLRFGWHAFPRRDFKLIPEESCSPSA